jgi:aryl sulfotransferase
MSDAKRSIVWIASYPKSGNTWLRFMLCSLIHGCIDSAAAFDRLAPDVHEVGQALDAVTGGLLVKTHYAYTPSMPLAARSAAAVYIVRDPADVLVSNFHYARRRAAQPGAAEGGIDAYFERFLAERGDPHWRGAGMGSWDGNVRSWLDPRLPFPVACVRYEDLAADASGVCARLAALVKPGASTAEIEAAVANASFARMRAIEEADIEARRVGIFYKPYLQSSIDAGVRFMRRGTAGAAAEELSAAQRARLRAEFGPLLAELGYWPR